MPASTYQHEVYMSALYTDPDQTWLILIQNGCWSKNKKNGCPKSRSSMMADFLKIDTSLYANELLVIVTQWPKVGHITSSLFASKAALLLLQCFWTDQKVVNSFGNGSPKKISLKLFQNLTDGFRE